MLSYRSSNYAAILSGILLILIFPRADMWALAWVALLPLLLAVQGKSPRLAFSLGSISGATAYMGIIYWIAYTLIQYGHLPFILGVGLLLLLVFYLALYIAFFAAVSAAAQAYFPRIWPLASAAFWVALEYIRTYFLTGFPWALLGYSQYSALPVIQIADITGVYGVSFLIILVNGVLAQWLIRYSAKDKPAGFARFKPPWMLYPALALMFLCILYGYNRLAAFPLKNPSGKGLRVAVIQGNIPQEDKWNPWYQKWVMDTYLRLLMENDTLPRAICFYTDGVKLVIEGSPLLERLSQIEQKGVRLIICSTCLDFFKITDKVRVGVVGGMPDIIEAQVSAKKVITL